MRTCRKCVHPSSYLVFLSALTYLVLPNKVTWRGSILWLISNWISTKMCTHFRLLKTSNWGDCERSFQANDLNFCLQRKDIWLVVCTKLEDMTLHTFGFISPESRTSLICEIRIYVKVYNCSFLSSFSTLFYAFISKLLNVFSWNFACSIYIRSSNCC